MRFKKGDSVVVKHFRELQPGWTYEMLDCCGKEGIVENTCGIGTVDVLMLDTRYRWVFDKSELLKVIG